VRVAAIFVAMVVLATPAHASRACMSKTEARRHFGSVHVYWHGSHHCWNATRGRRHVVPRVNQKNPQPRQQSEPEWRASRPEMSPDNGPTPSVPVRIEHVHVQSEPVRSPTAQMSAIAGGASRSERQPDRPVDSVAAIPMIKAESEAVAAAPLIGAVGASTTTVLGVVLLLFGTTLAGVGALSCFGHERQ